MKTLKTLRLELLSPSVEEQPSRVVTLPSTKTRISVAVSCPSHIDDTLKNVQDMLDTITPFSGAVEISLVPARGWTVDAFDAYINRLRGHLEMKDWEAEVLLPVHLNPYAPAIAMILVCERSFISKAPE